MADRIENKSDRKLSRLSDRQIEEIYPSLARKAKRIYDERLRRRSIISLPIFDEPGWDMLLDLYWHRAQGRKISVSSACLASNAPSTTALRYLLLLEENGWVESTESNLDKRTRLVAITDLAVRAISQYLAGAKGASNEEGSEMYLIKKN